MNRPRILLADDHPMVLEGIARLVEEFGDVVGKVEDGRTLLEETQRLNPDIVVMDISMPSLNGLEAARHIKKLHPRCHIIFLTMHGDSQYVTEAFASGGSGYLLKRSAGTELQLAMEAVLKGQRYVTPLVRHAEWPVMRPSKNGNSGYFKILTSRQREVLQLVAEGNSLKEIASLLHVSPKTVDFHKSKVMETLGLHSVADLTRYAVSHGLVEKSSV